MFFSEEIKRVRERSFLTQTEFARELGVAFSTVNRWEGGKSRPNLSAMKRIKEFCGAHDFEYIGLEEAWLSFKAEDEKAEEKRRD